MKQFLSMMFLLLLAFSMAAQKKTYLLFDPSCMDRLEFRYKNQNSGSSVLSYSVKPTANELLMLDIGAESIKVEKSVPKGALSCNNFNFGEAQINAFNGGSERLYIVRKVEKGYLVTPVGTVTKVTYDRGTFLFVGHGMRFRLPENTDVVSGSENLSTGNNFVFFQSLNNNYCLPIYTILREPDDVCTVKTDYAFMPGVGFVAERTGLDEAGKKQNALYLHRVNGSPVESFIQSKCPGAAQQQPKAVAPTEYHAADLTNAELDAIRQTPKATTPAPAAYQQKDATAAADDIRQAGKASTPATYSQKDATAPAQTAKTPYQQKDATEPQTTKAVAPAPKCKEEQGEGYHIVQPRESLNAIAKAYGVKLQNVVQWNKIPNPNYIEVCQKIWLMPPPTEVTDAPAPKATEKPSTKPAEYANAAPPKVERQWGEPAAPVGYAAAEKPSAKPLEQAAPTGPPAWNQPSTKAGDMGAYYTDPKSAPVAAAAPKQEQPAVLPSGRTATPTDAGKSTPTQSGADALAATKPQQYVQPLTYSKAAPVQETFGTQKMHVVQEGDTWYALAKMYGYTVDRFTKMNGLLPSDKLMPGMKLMVSDCSCPSPNGYEPSTETAAPTTYSAPTTAPVPSSESDVFTETTVSGENGSRVTYADSPTTTPKSVAPVVYNTSTPTTSSGILKTHIVQKGETLTSIATIYRVQIADLLRWNNLESNEVILPGKTLIVQR